ncbi:TPA: hypothetical protein JAN58_10255 [Legionella pneumophila]|nr:hypothetical protein [Legionella pneumophila]
MFKFIILISIVAVVTFVSLRPVSQHNLPKFKNEIFKNDTIYIDEAIDDTFIGKNQSTYLLEFHSSAYKRINYTITGNLNRTLTRLLVEKTIADKKNLEEVVLQISPTGSNYEIYNELSNLIVLLRKNKNIKAINIISSIPITDTYGLKTLTSNYLARLLFKNDHLETLVLNANNIDLHELSEGLEQNKALKHLIIYSPSMDAPSLYGLRLAPENKLQSIGLSINKNFYHEMKELMRIIDSVPSIREVRITSPWGSSDFLRHIILGYSKLINRKITVKSFFKTNIFNPIDSNYEKKNNYANKIRNIIFAHDANIILEKCFIHPYYYRNYNEKLDYCSYMYNENTLRSFEQKLEVYVNSRFAPNPEPYDLYKTTKDLLNEYPLSIREKVQSIL